MYCAPGLAINIWSVDTDSVNRSLLEFHFFLTSSLHSISPVLLSDEKIIATYLYSRTSQLLVEAALLV